MQKTSEANRKRPFRPIADATEPDNQRLYHADEMDHARRYALTRLGVIARKCTARY